MDLEMTGLDPEHDVILEVASIVTDADLNVIAEGPEIAIAHTEAELGGMDDWNVKHHTASGLLARVRSAGISTTEAEAVTLAFLE
ncbi:MAG TPA: exonuclease domain-containing protein, partial [Pseudomonadales bacterium]